MTTIRSPACEQPADHRLWIAARHGLVAGNSHGWKDQRRGDDEEDRQTHDALRALDEHRLESGVGDDRAQDGLRDASDDLRDDVRGYDGKGDGENQLRRQTQFVLLR